MRPMSQSSVSMTLIYTLLAMQLAPVPSAHAQFGNLKKKLFQAAACGGGAIGGYKLGDKLAEFEAQKMKLNASETAAIKRKYEVGMALALCNGGSAIAGTTYAHLSERDKKAREKAIDDAVADASPATRNYALPDHPDMTGTITTDPVVADANNECRTVEDHLAEGSRGDSALVKYCHKPPDGPWDVATGV